MMVWKSCQVRAKSRINEAAVVGVVVFVAVVVVVVVVAAAALYAEEFEAKLN